MTSSRLVLGTAQLGMDYGIANQTGKPDLRTAREIVCAAWEGGIRCFDTAQAYGESEKILGEILANLGISNQARIITKLAPRIGPGSKEEMKKALRESLSNLKRKQLYCLMLHREGDLDVFSTELADLLKGYIAQGLIERIGISLYSPARAMPALETGLISILQLPANLCDRRFHETGIFEAAERQNAEVYIRSVFLQGLLLMDSSHLPPQMQYAAPIIHLAETLCRELNLSRQELALTYIKQKYPQALVVIGAETKQQLVNNLAAWNGEQTRSVIPGVEEIFSSIDEKIINPTLWP